MLNETLLLGFIIATLLVVATPGPSVVLASSQAMRFGMKAATLTAIGDALGTICHILIATLGLQLIIHYADSVLSWLQIVGGAYLLYLAYQSMKAKDDITSAEFSPNSDLKIIASGFIACVSNPKAIVFFMALFPGFIDPSYNVSTQSFLYGVIFVVLDVICILGYAIFFTYIFKKSFSDKLNFNVVSGIGLFAVATILIVRGVVAT
ncbi:MAG: LysE family translocator [Pelistega sp.]|nr:LysE family translocator [Pelistega sp.]